jgi:hypothetical protein
MIRSQLQALCDSVDSLELLEAVPLIKNEADYWRVNGYYSPTIR